MDNKQDKWIDEVFESMKDHKKISPRPIVFDKIIAKITTPEVKIIKLSTLRLSAVAAMFLLLINTFVLKTYASSYNLADSSIDIYDANELQLISSFQIYE